MRGVGPSLSPRAGQGSADWDSQWLLEPLDLDAPLQEMKTPRWKAQERLILERYGTFDGLSVIEIGAGRGTNALLYAMRGAAKVTLLDLSHIALEQATELFKAHQLEVETIKADLFDPPEGSLGAFDVSMSFGVCEHFLGDERRNVVAAHLNHLRPGGTAMIGVPNRWSPAYRLWMAVLKRRGSWPLGTEVPFSTKELRAIALECGGQPLAPRFGSFLASVVNHGINQLLFNIGRKGLQIPQLRTPLLDRFAYELLLPVVRP